MREVLTGRFPDTEAAIQQALSTGWLKSVDVETAAPALPDLDEGEAASVRLAGTAAVIGMARQRGLIAWAREVFAQLHASNFRIAPAVIHAVLDRCGERGHP